MSYWPRQEPCVRAWSQAYRDDALIVIGVHTAELAFVHDIDLVHEATAERVIDYPVAVHDDYAIWTRSRTATGRRCTSSTGTTTGLLRSTRRGGSPAALRMGRAASPGW